MMSTAIALKGIDDPRRDLSTKASANKTTPAIAVPIINTALGKFNLSAWRHRTCR